MGSSRITATGSTFFFSSAANRPRGITAPRMKPPKMAWMPMASIRKAEKQNSARVMPSTVRLISPSRSTMRPSGASRRRPNSMMNAA